MHPMLTRCSALGVFLIAGLLLALPSAAHAGGAKQGRAAVERGLTFLQADAVKWRKERACATCHHGTMTVWALVEAKANKYPVDAAALADMTQWTRERLKDIDKPRDTRPGWNMVNSPAVYLAAMAQAVPAQQAVPDDELKRIAGHLLRHQEADGSWSWASAPAKNRPPPFFESDEVVTLLASMALGPFVAKDAGAKSPERDARARAAAWLAKNQSNDTTQAAAVRLLFKVRAGEPAKVLAPEIDALLRRQNKDGGWGQLRELPSDAYATGQALYVLSLAGVKKDRDEIRRGVAFLVGSQKDDGSWPMNRRGHPGVTPGPNTVPIIYFGSAWATLGLMRSVPK
jgi:squalene-hopene/tetraprenyl-beta-curcumene cyclase